MRRYYLVCDRPRCGCIDVDDTGDDCACRVAVAGSHTCLDCGAELVTFDREIGEVAGVDPKGDE